MGGYGSGRSGYRGVLEHYWSLDVNRFQREGMLHRSGWTTWAWYEDDERVASIGIGFSPESLELQYTINPGEPEAQQKRHRVPVTWTPCHYGGERPWFVCPNQLCRRRVGKLYLCGGYFICRHCTRAAYASQNETRSDRLMRRARKIRRRLGAGVDLTESIWRKPKGMHWRTFERLCDEAETADNMSLLLAVRRFGIRF
jgi:hypothetical protein